MIWTGLLTGFVLGLLSAKFARKQLLTLLLTMEKPKANRRKPVLVKKNRLKQ